MKYTVLIEESDEGFAVSVPGLPGCHSQGDTEAEALTNIADAIREYLEVVQELLNRLGPNAPRSRCNHAQVAGHQPP
jgi:predicted RNase H-like HicB family nuclease